jgi:hypothetical protein
LVVAVFPDLGLPKEFSQGAKTTKVVLGLILRIDIYGKLHGISILR